MARLESDGYLVKPHTSAGRVPTTRGYRVYVDRLMSPARVPTEGAGRLHDAVSDEPSLSVVMRTIVSTLAEVSGLTAFALAAPQETDERHRHVEFVRLKRGEVLAIFATWSGRVHHKHLAIELDVSQAELNRFHNYLNARFAGLTLGEIRELVQDELRTVERRYSTLASRALSLSQQAMPESDERVIEVVVTGQHHLMSWPELAIADVAGGVLEELERRQTWVQLLDAIDLAESSVTVIIGAENDVQGLQPCAVVAAQMPWENGVVGSIGMVGPMRLSYASAIAMLTIARDRVLSHRLRRSRA